jgi:hypothetical protein
MNPTLAMNEFQSRRELGHYCPDVDFDIPESGRPLNESCEVKDAAFPIDKRIGSI